MSRGKTFANAPDLFAAHSAAVAPARYAHLPDPFRFALTYYENTGLHLFQDERLRINWAPTSPERTDMLAYLVPLLEADPALQDRVDFIKDSRLHAYQDVIVRPEFDDPGLKKLTNELIRGGYNSYGLPRLVVTPPMLDQRSIYTPDRTVGFISSDAKINPFVQRTYDVRFVFPAAPLSTPDDLGPRLFMAQGLKLDWKAFNGEGQVLIKVDPRTEVRSLNGAAQQRFSKWLAHQPQPDLFG